MVTSAFLILTGCSNPQLPKLGGLPEVRDLPFIYKIDVQQGNVVEQDMVTQLRKGMDKKKVQFIMGTPIIKDTFNDKRWDYVYTYEYGGGHTERRNLTLIFDQDQKLDRVEGGVKATSQLLIADVHHDTTIRVPNFEKTTYVQRLKRKIPFTSEERKPLKTETLEDGTEVVVDEDIVRYSDEELDEMFAIEQTEPSDPYQNIQSAPGESVIVPPDAPLEGKKKGFFSRFFDGIGLGADETEAPTNEDYDPGDPKYRDITDQDDV